MESDRLLSEEAMPPPVIVVHPAPSLASSSMATPRPTGEQARTEARTEASEPEGEDELSVAVGDAKRARDELCAFLDRQKEDIDDDNDDNSTALAILVLKQFMDTRSQSISQVTLESDSAIKKHKRAAVGVENSESVLHTEDSTFQCEVQNDNKTSVE